MTVVVPWFLAEIMRNRLWDSLITQDPVVPKLGIGSLWTVLRGS